MDEFVTPVFLKNHSPEENFALMKRILPADLDLSPGGHAYNLIMPTALVVAELCEFVLPEVVKLIFPEWSYGQYLENHARSRGMIRRAAAAATGKLTITGTVGTIIPAHSLFSTAAVNGEPSVDYTTLLTTKIPLSGSVEVLVQCTKSGTVGNAPAYTINHVSSRITGIKSVTNNEPVTGGTEAETDESLINRILEFDRSLGESFVGSVADYRRWALSVNGVGGATVISAQDTTGLVTIILTDSNGEPATTQLCRDVYNYIMRPDIPEERLAPVNALLEVTPPQTIDICIRVKVELSADATIAAVREAFLDRITQYLPVAMEDKEIKYTRVAAALASVEGVNDFADLEIGQKINGEPVYGTKNIGIAPLYLPVMANEGLILNYGEV